MKLKLAPVPTGASEALESGLNRLGRSADAQLRAASADDLGGGIVASIPHPVYMLDASTVKGRSPLRHARRVGIRYLLGPQGGSGQAAEIRIDDGGSVTGFNRLTTGPHSAATMEALSLAEHLDGDQGVAEVRVLEIPGLYVAVLWLATKAVSKDMFIPLESAGPDIVAMRPMTSRQFVDALRQAANHDSAGLADYPA